MSEPFIAEIRIFAGNFAPRGWAFCDGQLLEISQNTALFSLIGTTYGGDGRTTTALPNMQGRAPMGPGRGPGLTARSLGQRVGAQTVTLSEGQIPSHTHTARATTAPGSENTPGNTSAMSRTIGSNTAYSNSETPATALEAAAVGTAGGGGAHNNLQPFLTLNYIIALVGLFPSRG